MLSLRGFALCDLEAPGWGEPWFPHSAVLLFFSQIFSLVARLLSPYQCYLMQSHFLLQCAIYGPLLHAMFPLFLFLFAAFLLVLFLVLFCCVSCLVSFSVSLHDDGLYDCVLVLHQHNFCGPSTMGIFFNDKP